MKHEQQKEQPYLAAGDGLAAPESELLPCPFCGAGLSQIQENGKMWTGMSWGEPASVSVRHWCAEQKGQPSRMLELVGRDRASAIAAWNRRTDAALRLSHAELLKALKDLIGPAVDPNIGWRGVARTSSEHFACEFCRVEDLDCSAIKHKPDCPVGIARTVTTNAEAAK
jgi:hypothetical protein